MCSACTGDYEDPEVTQEAEETQEREKAKRAIDRFLQAARGYREAVERWVRNGAN